MKIVATGGTIANTPTGRLAVDTVLAQIPQIAQHARIEVVDLIRVGSSSITVQNWLDISAAVRTPPPRRCMADSNESRVRVLGS